MSTMVCSGAWMGTRRPQSHGATEFFEMNFSAPPWLCGLRVYIPEREKAVVAMAHSRAECLMDSLQSGGFLTRISPKLRSAPFLASFRRVPWGAWVW